MADQPRFLALLQAVDHVTGPVNAIMGKIRGLGTAAEKAFDNPWRNAVGGAAEKIQHLGAAAEHAGTVAGEAEKAGHELQHLGGHAEHAGHEIGKIAHGHHFHILSAHVKLLRTHFGNLSTSVGEVGHSFSDLLPMLGALGGITSVGGIFEMVNRASDQESVLENTASAIGVTTRQLLAMNLAAEHADVPVSQMQRSMERFNATVGKAASGTDKQAAALFQHLGIALKDAHGHAVPFAQLMPKIMDALKNTHDQAMRSRMAMQLFGRAGIEMLPFLQEGSEAWRRYNEESRKVDYDPTQKEREGLRKFHDDWIDLRHAIDSVEVAIGAKLGPVLRPVVKDFKDWVSNNRDKIAKGVTEEVKALAKALKTIHIKAIVEDFGYLAKHAVAFAGAIGPMPATIGAVGLALGAPLLSKLVGVIRDLKELTTWAVTAARAIGTTLVAALKSAGQGIKGLDAVYLASNIGRTANVAFQLYDMAHAARKVAENPAQKKYFDSLHLKMGQALTNAQREHFSALASPLHKGPSFDQRARAAIASVLGLSGAPAGPIRRNAPGPHDAGSSHMTVEFKNAPAGMSVDTKATGGAVPPFIRIQHGAPLGFAHPGGGGF